MRSLLYFRFEDAVSAKAGWDRLLPLGQPPAHVSGPWFFGEAFRPVKGFPAVDATHITFRREGATAGYAICALLGAVIAGYYSDRATLLVGIAAYCVGFVIGGIAGWCLGGLAGSRVVRPHLARHAAVLSEGEILMVVGCKTAEKGKVRSVLCGSGGVGVEEHGDLLPHLR
ncbi:hypothetical protein AB4Z48_38325 [Cupriavidus sp. 2TAF22]|uniref:hypothetical protein n=1 Tax=unclassified Cupriavidus TaxID=2640874 RepID=UPI003F905E47